MPIYEYRCEECGTKFEKLVRRDADADGIACPSCGQTHLKQEYSVFSAHANTAPKPAEAPPCPRGGCCNPETCGMNFN